MNKLTDGGYGIFEQKDVRRLAMAAAYCGRTLEAYLLYQETLLDALTGLKTAVDSGSFMQRIGKDGFRIVVLVSSYAMWIFSRPLTIPMVMP